MLIYVDELLQEIDSILEYARIIAEKFEQGREPSELLLDAKTIRKRLQDLDVMMPEECHAGAALRHANFMIYYLEKNDVNSCRQDITDIVNEDLPTAVAKVRSWANSLVYVDADLREDIAPLIRTNQLDSAIRKSFVVLKSRLCNKFGLDEKRDGQDLVNEVFGARSNFFQNIDAGEKQAYRDFFAGLFGMLRNRFAHNDVEATLTDLDAVVSSVNLCLEIVGDFRVEQSTSLRGSK